MVDGFQPARHAAPSGVGVHQERNKIGRLPEPRLEHGHLHASKSILRPRQAEDTDDEPGIIDERPRGGAEIDRIVAFHILDEMDPYDAVPSSSDGRDEDQNKSSRPIPLGFRLIGRFLMAILLHILFFFDGCWGLELPVGAIPVIENLIVDGVPSVQGCHCCGFARWASTG